MNQKKKKKEKMSLANLVLLRFMIGTGILRLISRIKYPDIECSERLFGTNVYCVVSLIASFSQPGL